MGRCLRKQRHTLLQRPLSHSLAHRHQAYLDRNPRGLYRHHPDPRSSLNRALLSKSAQRGQRLVSLLVGLGYPVAGFAGFIAGKFGCW